jgi:acetylglutamate kinase
VVVHGAGPEITRLARTLGLQTTSGDGPRAVKADEREDGRVTLLREVNEALVGLIGRKGGTAVGLSGVDGDLIEVEPPRGVAGAGAHAGPGPGCGVKSIDTRALDLLGPSVVPVVASVGADPSGGRCIADSDLVAGELAAALGAQRVIFLTDVAGLFDDDAPEKPWVGHTDLVGIERLEARGVVSGGMVLKMTAVRKALEGGVRSAHILDGRIEHAVLREILTDDVIGTTITS